MIFFIPKRKYLFRFFLVRQFLVYLFLLNIEFSHELNWIELRFIEHNEFVHCIRGLKNGGLKSSFLILSTHLLHYSNKQRRKREREIIQQLNIGDLSYLNKYLLLFRINFIIIKVIELPNKLLIFIFEVDAVQTVSIRSMFLLYDFILLVFIRMLWV